MIYKYLFISFFIAALAFVRPCIAVENKYPVSSIADSLQEHANAVVRNEELVFEIKDIEHATLKISYAITILNKSALNKSYFAKPYDQFSKVNHIKGAVYDANGDLVRKIKLDEINDFSANSSGSLFHDIRVKFINPDYYKYPFTVEYSCEIDYHGLLNYPAWQIYPDFNVSVERSTFALKRPGHIKVRNYNRNVDVQEVDSVEDGDEVQRWEISGMMALTKEKFSEDLEKTSPAILFAPTDFMMDGYEGNCETWEGFGEWIYLLNQNQKELPSESVSKIQDLIKSSGSDYEKAEILYQYLQNNTRYVSVQIGIGSWQPIEAEQVDRLSYGDCKALTNYMQTLLEVAGIQSYYTLVRAGENSSGILSEFPSNQFNHAILCALIEGDTVWLECTSQRVPFGYIGSFTDDRDVLLISEKGGELARTKVYNSDVNRKICNAVVSFNDEGNGLAHLSTDFNGVYYDEKLPVLISDKEDQKRLIREEIHIPNFVLDDFSFKETREIIPSINEQLELSMNGCATKFGNRMSVNLNLINKTGMVPSKKEGRRTDIFVRRSTVEIDTLIFKIPENYAVEKASGNRDVKSKFGELKTEVSYTESEIQFIRYLKLNKGTYPAETYDEFYEFYKTIKKGDDDKVILIAKD